ncbi:MAG: hypothetical protein HC867_09570 [Bacteroidia bacterium]|nr:hypothetical protein [Bacteroidia bacterium]
MDTNSKIAAPDRNAANAWFGSSVSISGTSIVVGTAYEDKDAAGLNPLNDAGAAYVFVFDAGAGEFVFEQKFTPSVRAANDRFGFSVGISGNYVVSGAYLQNTDASGANPLSSAGAAYIFFRTGSVWAQQAKLVAFDRAAGDFFGTNVSIDGDVALVGASLNDKDASGANIISNAGGAYIFSQGRNSLGTGAKNCSG